MELSTPVYQAGLRLAEALHLIEEPASNYLIYALLDVVRIKDTEKRTRPKGFSVQDLSLYSEDVFGPKNTVRLFDSVSQLILHTKSTGKSIEDFALDFEKKFPDSVLGLQVLEEWIKNEPKE